MATEVILPKVDMDMSTGTIAVWHVKDGDTVKKGQPLFDIETDKAAMEIESPAEGVIRIGNAPVKALALPLLSKDVIKERLADVLGQRAEPEVWTKALGSASMELIWTRCARPPWCWRPISGRRAPMSGAC